jgi:DNA-binding NtrC family response regulator
MMKEILALLLHAPTEPLGQLKLDLENQFIKVDHLRKIEGTLPMLNGANPPHLVFTGTALPDGTWADVVKLAVEASKPVNVIVIAPLVNIGLYLETMGRGAFDFIVLPLAGHELLHVVRCAADNVIKRREAQAVAA